jgi:ArsR family transcriptional regulator
MSKYSNENLDQFAAAFKALANPNRLQIYQRLRSCCSPGTECAIEEAAGCCVGELGADLDIALSTLSHHLKELQRAGLVNTRRQGKQIHCSVNPDMVDALANYFRSTS